MTTYYVRGSMGSDGNTGLSPAQAWEHIDYAANNVAAGDTVHIGAWVYRELVTMDTSGNAGNVISFLGDFTGVNTGDAGLVVVTAWDDEEHWELDTPRQYALELNQHQFLTFSDMMLIGGNTNDDFAVNSTGAGDVAFEQVTFTRCVLCSMWDSYAVYLIVGDGATPATTGFTFDQCTFWGGILLVGDNNASAHQNLKANITACTFYGREDSASYRAALYVNRSTTASAYSFGGVTMKSCTAIGFYTGIVMDSYNKNATNPCYIYNSTWMADYTGRYLTSGCVAGAWEMRDCRYNETASVLTGPPVLVDTREACLLPGFLVENIWRYHLGWCPYRSMELIDIGGVPAALNQADPTYLPSADIVGNSYAQSLAGQLSYFYFDASDAAVTDPDAKWAGDASICDGVLTNHAFTTTQGSDASNYLMAEGVEVGGRTSVVDQVRVRVFGYAGGAAQDVQVRIYTNGLGENLGTLTYTLPLSGAKAWSAWTTLSVPAAGWDWATVSALEFKCWKNVAGVTAIYVSMIQVEVRSGANGTLGAMQTSNLEWEDTVVTYEGENTIALTGAGYVEYFIPVSAVETTITALVRYDANYGGASLPQLLVMEIPGVADQTDTMTGPAGAFEELSVTFTPTEASVVRVWVLSRDTSRGKTNLAKITAV